MNYRSYLKAIEDAESAMIGKGKTSIDDRIYMFGGIYYATTWSVEYVKLHADDRRKAFERCLNKTYSPLDDPRPIIGSHLFALLSANQDVADAEPVDMGHMLIGLAARLNVDARTKILSIADLGGIPFMPSFLGSTKSTGLEILTWVGDLGGGTGRLALDRAQAAATAKPGTTPATVPASKYFRGDDYGGPGNLYGDVYASTLAAGTSGGIDRPAIGPPLSTPLTLADAFRDFFVPAGKGAKPAAKAGACAAFLRMAGATYAAGSLANQSDVESAMADKFEAFGYFYIYSYLKTFGPMPSIPPPPPPSGGFLQDLENLGTTLKQGAAALGGAVMTIQARHSAAVPFLRKAAEDVAQLFVSKLLKNSLR